MRKLPALAAACLFLLAAFAPAAAHASVGQILRDCQLHGKLTRHYSQQDYRNALAQLQGDQSEYSDCESTIRAAQAADARASAANHQSHSSGGGHSGTTGGTHSGGGSNGAGSGPRAVANHGASKADQNAIHRAAKQSDAVPLPSGGTISPTTASASGGSGLHAMPVPLRIVLILLAAGALTGVGLGLRRRVLDRRSDT
jgi:cobalamin biosynthesis Mg chelatase CobN